ncbi:MAG: helix-hairpin-helix domain-containing protein [Gammaproteobacteria bacterium]|jgi:competence protein ComEA
MKLLRNMLLACLLSLPLSVQAAPPVNINTADSQVLVDELVGVGPHKAMAIVRYRQENGPFQTVDDLALVSGIGPRTVEQNRARMIVELPEQTP